MWYFYPVNIVFWILAAIKPWLRCKPQPMKGAQEDYDMMQLVNPKALLGFGAIRYCCLMPQFGNTEYSFDVALVTLMLRNTSR